MAQTFTREIEREITFRSSVRGIPARTWMLEIGPRGIGIREKGSSHTRRLTWYQIVSFSLVHAVGRDDTPG